MPRLYAEDPRTPGELEPSPEEMKQIRRWAAREHIAEYLARLGESDLSLRLRDRLSDAHLRVERQIWRGTEHGVEGLDFVGRLRPAYWWEYGPFPFAFAGPWGPRRMWHEEMFIFEGIDLQTLKTALRGEVPDTRRFLDRTAARRGTLLRDGTVVLPAGGVREDRLATI